ncbi:MAG: S8 family serine peptidase [Pseudomonadota bacterium]
MKHPFVPSSLALAIVLAASSPLMAGGPAGSLTPSASSAPDLKNLTPQQRHEALRQHVLAKSGESFAPFRVIVKFKDQTWTQGFSYGRSVANASVLATQTAMSAEMRNALGSAGARVAQAYPGMGVMVLEVFGHAHHAVGAAIEALYRSGTVEYAHPDYIVKAQKIPKDTDYNALWGLHNDGQTGGVADADIDAPEAWDKRISSRGSVVVGVIDSGVDYTHPELVPSMWTNPGEIPANGIDDEGNGYIDDVYGIDAYNHDSDPMDDNSHGTHVAGTIGARGNNNQGVVGVNWLANVMALKFLGADGSGPTSGAIEAINYALDAQTRHNLPRIVLNNSWGGGGFSQALLDAINASMAQGALFVAAAGNDASDVDLHPHYPSSYDVDNIVSVGASTMHETLAGFSNYGCAQVDLVAPGDSILSTVPGNGYEYKSGTSMATPHVAGAAALLWAQNPNFTWRNVKAALLNGADVKSDYASKAMTSGRLNLNSAMAPKMGTNPSVWKLEPAVVQADSTLSIHGNRFGATPGAVTIRGLAASIVSWSNSKIVVKVPANVGYGAGKVIVTDAAGTRANTACVNAGSEVSVVDQLQIPRYWHAGAKVGEHYWLIGGYAPWGYVRLVERYTPATGESVVDQAWTSPVTFDDAISVAVGDKIYVIGSWLASNAVYIFDTQTGVWSQGAPLADFASIGAASAVALGDGRIYLFGGYTDQGYSNRTYRYDPVSNAWERLADMPYAQQSTSAVRQGASNEAWVIGGDGNAPDWGRTVMSYNADSNSWQVKLPTAFYHNAGMAVWYQGRSYVLFGDSSAGRGELWYGGKWVETFKALQALTYPRGDVFDDAVYAMGGFDYATGGHSASVLRIGK